MWQSELLGGDLPMICAVTGQPAESWEQYDFHVDAEHTESDDEKFHGWLGAAGRPPTRRSARVPAGSSTTAAVPETPVTVPALSRWDAM